MNIDHWFRQIRAKYQTEMQCGRGCTACCHGLFDISLSDAVEVARGFRDLPEKMQEQVLSRATVLHEAIRESADNSKQPTLFDEDDARIDRIVDAARVPPCPCLGNAGECLIYEHRPMACRLEGVPMIDVNDGLFGDWCDLNFKEGLSETAKADLKQDYNHIGEIQETRSAAAAHRAGISDCSTVTFIPSVIAEYENFWKRLLT